MVTSSKRRPDEGTRAPARSGGEAAYRAGVELVVIGRPSEGGRVARTIERLGLADAVHCVSGITDDELARLYAEAEVAVVPSLYEGSRCPRSKPCRVEWPSSRRRGRASRGRGQRRRDGTAGAADDPGALAVAIGRLLDDPALRARLGEAGRERVRGPLHLAGDCVGHGRLLPGDARGTPLPGAPSAAREVVGRPDADGRLRPPRRRAGRPVLDLGAASAATPSRRPGAALGRGTRRRPRRGGPGACDARRHGRGRRARARSPGPAVQGDALAPALPRRTFDRVIASEVLEHIPDDAAPWRELARVLQPGWRHGGDGAPLRARGGQLGALGRVPRHARAATSAFTGVRPCERRLRATGLVPTGIHHAHGLHSPYWWLRCLVGPATTSIRRGGVPQGAGVGHRQGSARDTHGGPGAQSADRQEPRRLPVEARVSVAGLPDARPNVPRGAPGRRGPTTPKQGAAA